MRDILVHLDGSAACARRIDTALRLARHLRSSRICGLFAQCLPDTPSLTWPPGRPLAEIAAEAERLWQGRVEGQPVTAIWRRRMCSRLSQLLDEMAAVAHAFDLTVMSPDDPNTESHGLPANFAEQIMLRAGRPVLVVPAAAPLPTLGESVLVAWNGGRESARALADALPILQAARQVAVTAIGPYQQRHFDGSAAEDHRDLKEHLSGHGVSAEIEYFNVEDVGVMDMLLSRAAELGADLLVMGAHAHYGFPHHRRGTGTRYILTQMTLPILFSN